MSGSRKYYVSVGQAFGAIRSQRAFDSNSNLEVRSAIRLGIRKAKSYIVPTSEKHKHRLWGDFSHFPEAEAEYSKGQKVIVKRMSESTFADCCMGLKFVCPYCGSQDMPPSKAALVAIYEHDKLAEIICDQCNQDGLRFSRGRLRILGDIAKVLQKGEVTDEEYDRLTERAYSGFNRPSEWDDNPLGSEGESLSGEEYHRHVEGGDSGGIYADGQIFSGFTTTHKVRSRLRRRWNAIPDDLFW